VQELLVELLRAVLQFALTAVVMLTKLLDMLVSPRQKTDALFDMVPSAFARNQMRFVIVVPAGIEPRLHITLVGEAGAQPGSLPRNCSEVG
jgi:hypothetical protein